jgi:hypothetical protein
MALISCRECQGKVSTEAESCPHCGCPVSERKSPYSEPVDAGPKCYSCGDSATRACTRCGAMCCEQHITWWGSPYKNYGATCSSCASFGWAMTLVGLIVGGIILLVFFANMAGGPFGR